MIQTEQYRITGIEKCTLNGHSVKMFEYYERNDNDYVFAGRFSAPANCVNKDLINYVIDNE